MAFFTAQYWTRENWAGFKRCFTASAVKTVFKRGVLGCIWAGLALMCVACNDNQSAYIFPSGNNSVVDTEVPLAASIEALATDLSVANARTINAAPANEGFTLRVSANTQADATTAEFSDSRMNIGLNSEINLHGNAQIVAQVWTQRQGPSAVILNAGTQQALALLPSVKTDTALTFGFAAVDSQNYVGEKLTTVGLLASDAPLTISTAIENELSTELLLEIALDSPATQTLTLNYQTLDGSALANQDYLAVTGQVIFEPGQRLATVRVPLLNDGPANTVTDANEGDEYFSLLVSGSVGAFTGTVRGYGVINNAEINPAVVINNLAQDNFAGSEGVQRVYLESADSGLELTVVDVCSYMNGDSQQCTTTAPLIESGEGWANIAWTTAPISQQRYLLNNSSALALPYRLVVFDGEQSWQIIGTVAANSQINAYTSIWVKATASSSTNSSSSSSLNTRSSVASSSASAAPTELQLTFKPQGLDATQLILNTQFDNAATITALSVSLNGQSITASPTTLTIPYTQLMMGANSLIINASDNRGTTLNQTVTVYFASAATNVFTGTDAVNIFIGQEGEDTFTGGDGQNIYVSGSKQTTYVSGLGQNIFIHQQGAAAMSAKAESAAIDQVVMPEVLMTALRVSQCSELCFYLEAEDQIVRVIDFFNPDGSIQSSIQRFIFADGELTAADIRRLVHEPNNRVTAYWGFTGDDILINDRDISAYGGAGNDTIRVNGFVSGGAGDDIIYTNGTAMGDDGDDEIHAGSPFGDAGNDVLYTTGERAFGGDGDDILHGNDADNKLFGDLGNNTFYGYGGNDSFFATGGNSTFYGGDGDDIFFASRGDFNDVIIGGNGNDSIWASAGINFVDGGDGDETFYVGEADLASVNTILCGPGTHVIYNSGQSDDKIDCDTGADLIYLASGNDEVYAGAGNDNVYGDAGIKYIELGEGDDYINLTGSDKCTVSAGAGDDDIYLINCTDLTVDGGDGVDTFVASGERVSVTGGAGDDIFIELRGQPYADSAEIDAPFTHIFWSPGDGDDSYNVISYAIAPTITLGTESSATTPLIAASATASPAPVGAIGSGQINLMPSTTDSTSIAVAGNIAESLIPTSHFYLSGNSAIEEVFFTQDNYNALMMHYKTANNHEKITFDYWFDLSTGQAPTDTEAFYDFVFPSGESVTVQSINQYFNRFFYRHFNAPNNVQLGFSVVGTPMQAEQEVIEGQSALLNNKNYLIKNVLPLTGNYWTLEFWVSIPSALTTGVTLPILQWGEQAEAGDGFGVALVNNGEGNTWLLRAGVNNSLQINNVDGLAQATHIAVVNNNHQLRLFINGQPSEAYLTPVFTDDFIAPLMLGFFDTANATTVDWYLDELLITQGEAKYSAPFEPVAEPFVLEFTPVPASALPIGVNE